MYRSKMGSNSDPSAVHRNFKKQMCLLDAHVQYTPSQMCCVCNRAQYDGCANEIFFAK